MSANVSDPSLVAAVTAPVAAPPEPPPAVERAQPQAQPQPGTSPAAARAHKSVSAGYALAVIGYALIFAIPAVRPAVAQKCFTVLVIGILLAGCALVLYGVARDALKG